MLASLLLACFLLDPQPASDPVVQVEATDAEMNAAIAQARATLPDFWTALGQHDATTDMFALKVAFPYGLDNHEHIWCQEVSRASTGISATVGNAPEAPVGVKLGDRVTVNEADVSDWMYTRDGKIIGAYTLRVLLAIEPSPELDSMLAPPDAR